MCARGFILAPASRRRFLDHPTHRNKAGETPALPNHFRFHDSVLLIPKFVAPRMEFSDLPGGPGFGPAEAELLSVGFSR